MPPPVASVASEIAKPFGNRADSAVTFTGGVWERGYAERLGEAAASPDIVLSLKRNLGAGATPGMWAVITNNSAETYEGVVVELTNILRWDEANSKWATSGDVHGNGKVFPRRLFWKTFTLHPGEPVTVDSFLSADPPSMHRLQINGHGEGGMDDYKVRKVGTWQISYEIQIPDVARIQGGLCFEWNGTSASPVECPDMTSVSLAPTQAERPTLLGMFKTDHDRTLRSTREITAKFPDGSEVKMLEQAYLDFSARAKFAGFYIPSTPQAFALAKQLVANVPDVFKQVETSVHIEQGHVAQSQTTSLKDLMFTGRVLIYHETAFTAREQADLEDAYRNAKMALEFVGPSHLSIRLMSDAYRP
jgi:hypothetical protein